MKKPKNKGYKGLSQARRDDAFAWMAETAGVLKTLSAYADAGEQIIWPVGDYYLAKLPETVETAEKMATRYPTIRMQDYRNQIARSCDTIRRRLIV